MRRAILLSILVLVMGIAAWTALHRHRQTQWLRAYREASDSLGRRHYRDAEAQLQSILAQQSQLTGREVALTQTLLAVLYRAEGRSKEAEPLFEKAIQFLAPAGQAARLDLANACNGEGRMFLEQGRWKEAEQRLQQSVDIYQKEPQKAGPEFGSALHNLGLVRIAERRGAEALSLLQQAIDIYTRNRGPDDPNLAQAYLDSAVEYRFESRPKEADDMDKKALAIQERVFGNDSPAARETRARLKLPLPSGER